MIPNVISVGERITLRTCQTEKFKSETLSLSAVLPLRRETAYLTTLLFAVLLRGTRTYPNLSALNRRLDYLFGTEVSVHNYRRGDMQVVGLAAEILNSAYLPQGTDGETLLPDALDVMREILFYPALDESGCLCAKYVESEKQLQCDSIRAQKNHPRAYAAERCRAWMYENEPCGISLYGTEEEIQAVTPESLTAYWRTFLSLLRLQCFYVGHSAGNTVATALQTAFAAELSETVVGGAVGSVLSPEPIRKAEQVKRREESLPVGQSHLVIGMRTGTRIGDADFYACTVFNELFGVSPISKIFMNVREKLSLCYSCSSTYNLYKGTLLISCGLEAANRALAEDEIFRQLSAIANGDFSEEELTAAKKSLENSYRQLQDSPGALESYYFGRALAGVEDPLEHCRQGFAAVRREDVIAAAKKVTLDTVFFLRQSTGEEENCDEDD
ncbi:MAG: insulinase family protein [Clostridia bacterium]|nr:insulinase family protein [Clostridia bacterium]